MRRTRDCQSSCARRCCCCCECLAQLGASCASESNFWPSRRLSCRVWSIEMGRVWPVFGDFGRDSRDLRVSARRRREKSPKVNVVIRFVVFDVFDVFVLLCFCALVLARMAKTGHKSTRLFDLCGRRFCNEASNSNSDSDSNSDSNSNSNLEIQARLATCNTRNNLKLPASNLCAQQQLSSVRFARERAGAATASGGRRQLAPPSPRRKLQPAIGRPTLNAPEMPEMPKSERNNKCNSTRAWSLLVEWPVLNWSELRAN